MIDWLRPLIVGIVFLICGCSDNSTQSESSAEQSLSITNDYTIIPQGMKISFPIEVHQVSGLASIRFKLQISDTINLHYDTTLFSASAELGTTFERLDDNTFRISENNDLDRIVNDTGYAYLGNFYYYSTVSSTDSISISISAIPVEMINIDGDTIAVDDVKTSIERFDLIRISSMVISHWTMDNHSIDSIFDSSPNNLNASFQDVSFITGAVGTGIEFDGVLTHMFVPDNPVLYTMDEVTIAMWVNARSGYGENFLANILARCDSNWNTKLGITYAPNQNKSISLFAESLYGDSLGSRRLGINQYPVDDGNWHFIAFSVKYDDSTSYLAMLDTLLSFDSSDYNPNLLLTDEPGLLIGCKERGMSLPHGSFASTGVFPGYIDEILILNRSMPYEFLRQLYFSYYLDW